MRYVNHETAQKIALQSGFPIAQVKEIMRLVREFTAESLARHERVEFREFGTFDVRFVKGYTRNYGYFESKFVPTFKPGKKMKDKVANLTEYVPLDLPPGKRGRKPRNAPRQIRKKEVD